MPRWSQKETEAIAIVRSRLADLLCASPAYPEVVGDRKIVRYLRGHDHNIDKVCDLMSKFLLWRKAKGVDGIRKHILQGADHPLRFPTGETILTHIKALVIDPEALDTCGSPICVEQYAFSPSEVLRHISIEDYIVYMMYTLEYRSMILEQLSEERERAYLASLSPAQRAAADEGDTAYGVLTHLCVVRDLGGVGFEHLGSQGQEIIKAVVTMASDNYPELMRKCYMVNTPWVFNTIWFFIKNLLAARTLAKVNVLGSAYMEELTKDIPAHLLPRLIGGQYVGYEEYVRYPFDLDYLLPKEREQADPLDDGASNADDELDERDLQVLEEIAALGLVEQEQEHIVIDVQAPSEVAAESTLLRRFDEGPAADEGAHKDTDSEEDIDISLISLQTSGF